MRAQLSAEHLEQLMFILQEAPGSLIPGTLEQLQCRQATPMTVLSAKFTSNLCCILTVSDTNAESLNCSFAFVDVFFCDWTSLLCDDDDSAQQRFAVYWLVNVANFLLVWLCWKWHDLDPTGQPSGVQVILLPRV